MGFIPKGAEAPKSDSNYLKLIEGTIKFRIVSDMIYGYEYWNTDKKPVRLREYPKEKPADIRVEKDNSFSIKHFWAFSVLDREDGRVKVFEITQNGIKRQLEDLFTNPDWSRPFEYDISITGKGDGMERRYTVQPSPAKELTKEEKSIVARTEINLNALYEGENPFDGVKVESGEKTLPRASGEATDDSGEIKISDIPF